MRERLQSPIPMWRVQYQLLGGHRRTLLIGLIYTTLLIAGILGIRRLLLSEPLSSVIPILLNGLSGIQSLVVVLGGCNAVYRATLRDYETRMIESHRLTPMSNITVVLGYLFGSTVQILVLFVINCAVGAVLTAMGSYPLGAWFYGNLLMLAGAVVLWTMFVFSGMRLAKPINPGPALLGLGLFSVPLLFVPGGALMLSVYAVLLAFWVITGTVTVAGQAVIIVASVSLVLICYWIFAAAAKYRRPDLPALNASRGLFLLVFWLVVATVGLVAYEIITRTRMRTFYESGFTRFQWIATIAGSLIMSTIVLSGTIHCRLLVASGVSPRDRSDRISDLTVALLAVVLIGLVSALVGWSVWPGLLGAGPESSFSRPGLYAAVWAITLGTCALALMTVSGVLTLAHSAFKSPGVVVGLFILFAWALPPVADIIRVELLRYREPIPPSWLFGCSPIGTIWSVWTPSPAVSLWPGLLIQLMLAAFCTVCAQRVWVRVRYKNTTT